MASNSSEVDRASSSSSSVNGISNSSKRSLKQCCVDVKSKKKMMHMIRRFVQHVCSPISNEKRRHAVAAILAPTLEFDKSELDELWKGIFFVVWYTEVTKCEEIFYDIAYGCHHENEKDYLLAGFKLLAREWMGIDYFRVDKYALLIRHMLNRSFRIVIFESEPRDFNFLDKIITTTDESSEMFTHIVEIFLEELQNVTMRKVIWNSADKCDVYVSAIKPLIRSIPRNNFDARIQGTIRESIFKSLPEALSSDVDSDWREKFFQQIFYELIETGKLDTVNSKNRKFLFRIAKGIKNRNVDD